MAPVATKLPQRLRDARCQAHTSREAAALAIERSSATITAYECGRATPPLGVLERLVDFYGVALADLVRADDQAVSRA
jgi:ribosome-binding protein aMBF1 (putative translation factor)